MHVRKIKPKKENGTIDKKSMKALFMASEHLAWKPFAKAYGLSPDRSRSDYPVNEWIAEKESIFQATVSDAINETMVFIKKRLPEVIKKDVEETLEVCDLAFKKIKEHLVSDFISIKDIQALMNSVGKIQEIKEKTLFLTHLKLSEDVFKIQGRENLKEETSPVEFMIKTKDGAELTASELTTMLSEYYDRPYDSTNPIEQ